MFVITGTLLVLDVLACGPTAHGFVGGVRIPMTGATKTCGVINLGAMIYLIDKKLALTH